MNTLALKHFRLTGNSVGSNMPTWNARNDLSTSQPSKIECEGYQISGKRKE